MLAPEIQPQSIETEEKIDVIVNRRSGTVLKLGEAAVRDGLVDSLGTRLGSINFIEGKDITASVREWTLAHKGDKRGLILGGGDGSVLTAAAEFLGRDDITLGVLPLGTHNLFARQLGFAADFRAAAKQYKNVENSRVDVGNVNGENFLVGLMIDQNSVDFYQARELWRDKKYFRAAGKFLSTVFGIVAGRKAKLDVAGQEQKGRIFLVTNNQLLPRANTGFVKPTAEGLKPVIENVLAKGDADGLLGFYAFAGGPHNLAMLLPKLWDGSWTAAKSVIVQTAPELLIQPGRAASTQLPIILDGEVKSAAYPLKVSILPQALPVYRPR
ncbi:MAG TPA: diacylglycerol kinase family protein [Patescibacteria group bacterium]|nr:diacylglycerol kinase family protein [Patescibacteria group bacterium]